MQELARWKLELGHVSMTLDQSSQYVHTMDIGKELILVELLDGFKHVYLIEFADEVAYRRLSLVTNQGSQVATIFQLHPINSHEFVSFVGDYILNMDQRDYRVTMMGYPHFDVPVFTSLYGKFVVAQQKTNGGFAQQRQRTYNQSGSESGATDCSGRFNKLVID